MKTVQFPGTAGLEAFVRPLTVEDLENCVQVESAFPEPERCSRQKASTSSLISKGMEEDHIDLQ